MELVDGRVFVGKQEYVALSVDTDDLDIYLVYVRQSTDGNLEVVEGIDRLVVRRADIRFIAVLTDQPTPTNSQH
jgi:hypothetical protein